MYLLTVYLSVTPFYFPNFGYSLLSLLWILFTGWVAISFGFVFSCGFVFFKPCFLICCMFLCLFILFNLLCLGSLFCRLEGHCSSYLWNLSPWVLLDQCLVKVSWPSRPPPAFCWMELDHVSLKGNIMPSSVFLCVYGLSMALGSLFTNRQYFVPDLLKVWHEAVTSDMQMTPPLWQKVKRN